MSGKLEGTSKKKWDLNWALSSGKILGDEGEESADKSTNVGAGAFSCVSAGSRWFSRLWRLPQ